MWNWTSGTTFGPAKKQARGPSGKFPNRYTRFLFRSLARGPHPSDVSSTSSRYSFTGNGRRREFTPRLQCLPILPRSSPINSPRPLCPSPSFPSLKSPQGWRNFSSELDVSAGISGEFRHHQWTPRLLLSPIPSLSPRRPLWCFSFD
jgi:hypothetical protein